MNKQILTVVAAVVLLSTSSGCTGMKNFLFGRGAKCGLCNRVGSPLGILPGANVAPPVAYESAPYAVAPPSNCGCNGHAHIAGDETCNGHDVGYGNPDPCLDGSYAHGSYPVDPYLNGGIVGSSVVPNQGEYIVGEGAIGPGTIPQGGYIPQQGYVPGSSLPDNFDARGDRIISAEPLPQGARLLP